MQSNVLKDTSTDVILPWHDDDMMLNTEAVLTAAWVANLKYFLRYKVDTKWPVTLVTSDSNFQEVLLNWIISATLGTDKPLQNTLIISLNTSLHEALLERGIASLNVPPSTLVNLSDVISAKMDRKYVEAVRIIVMRLVNHWGFDVAMYDADAIILSNPNELYRMYSSSDVIAATGHTPTYLYSVWGVTLCMGAVMVRSNLRTEVLWENMHLIKEPDDQTKANKALRAMNITWKFEKGRETSQPNTWHSEGVTYPHKLTVTLLNNDVFCRELDCDMSRKGEYYVWHQGGMHSLALLIKRAKTAGVWLLEGALKTERKAEGTRVIKQYSQSQSASINRLCTLCMMYMCKVTDTRYIYYLYIRNLLCIVGCL